MNITLDDLKTITCKYCGNSVFKTNSSIFKKLPSIQSPTGKAQLIKVDLISCPACNHFFHIKDGELFSISMEEPSQGNKNET